MKDIFRNTSPQSNIEFKSQTPPQPQKPKVVFPVTPKKIENGSLKPDGKNKGPQKPKNQPMLPFGTKNPS